MGFFWFFKKKEESKEKDIEHISFKDIETWIEDSLAPFKGRVENSANSKRNNMLSISQDINQRLLLEFKQAKLKNPNIPEREKQFMEGNRDYYIKATSQLLNKINLQGIDILDLPSNVEEAEKNLDRFGKTTTRSYHILHEFFSHEVRKITEKIHEMSVVLKELKMILDNSPVFRVKDVLKRIESLKKSVLLKKKCQEGLKEDHDILISYEHELKEQEKKLDKLKESEEYHYYVKLQSEYKDTHQSIKGIEREITEFFLPLQKALKKYSRISLEDEKIILSYAEEPVKAFELDSESRIMFILQNLKREIEKGSIDLIEKKKEKAIERVDEATPKKFEMFSKSLGNLRAKLKRIKEGISENRFEEMEGSLQYSINDFKERIEKIRKGNKRLSEESSLLRVEKEKERIEEEIYSLFSKRVVLEI